jgi:hypothetical protein
VFLKIIFGLSIFKNEKVKQVQGFKKRSRSRLGNVKIIAISVGTGVATLIVVVVV